MVAIIIFTIIIICIYIIINIDGITVKDCIYFMLIILGILLGNIMSSYSYEIKNDSNKSEALKSFIKKDTLFIDRDNITILIPK
jgi:hypothetical protein